MSPPAGFSWIDRPYLAASARPDGPDELAWLRHKASRSYYRSANTPSAAPGSTTPASWPCTFRSSIWKRQLRNSSTAASPPSGARARTAWASRSTARPVWVGPELSWRRTSCPKGLRRACDQRVRDRARFHRDDGTGAGGRGVARRRAEAVAPVRICISEATTMPATFAEDVAACAAGGCPALRSLAHQTGNTPGDILHRGRPRLSATQA